jgi:hypothetical protein
MYKSTAGGWSQVSFEHEIAFTVGSGASTIIEGGTLTQGGVTATIRRVLVRTGSLAAGTAAGTMVISAPAGGNFAAGAATVGAGTLTLSGAESAITLATGGRFEFKNHNFGGAVNTKRMYGCDGTNPAFEFDGTYFVPIRTGMTIDAPSQIWVHKNQLFLAFMGSVQHSGPGTPYAFSLVLGAAEIAMGDTVTGMRSQPGDETGGALLLATRNKLSVLYGSGSSDWNLVGYSDEAGAFAYSMQQVAQSLMLDDRGLTALATTAAFGNFDQATISRLVKPWINARKTRLSASTVVREKNQYRIFFSDKYALYVTIVGKKVMGMLPCLFQHDVKCICSAEFSDGSERIFFGSTDGFVYEMDKGTSFDGGDKEFYLYLTFNHSKSPRTLKHYREAVFEVSGEGYTEFVVSYDLGYQASDIESSPQQDGETEFSARNWDVGNWDTGFWDGRVLSPSAFDLDGSAENISLKIAGIGDYFDSITFNGVMIDFSPRRKLR